MYKEGSMIGLRSYVALALLSVTAHLSAQERVVTKSAKCEVLQLAYVARLAEFERGHMEEIARKFVAPKMSSFKLVVMTIGITDDEVEMMSKPRNSVLSVEDGLSAPGGLELATQVAQIVAHSGRIHIQLRVDDKFESWTLDGRSSPADFRVGSRQFKLNLVTFMEDRLTPASCTSVNAFFETSGTFTVNDGGELVRQLERIVAIKLLTVSIRPDVYFGTVSGPLRSPFTQDHRRPTLPELVDRDSVYCFTNVYGGIGCTDFMAPNHRARAFKLPPLKKP
jgi:hypothetical protein